MSISTTDIRVEDVMLTMQQFPAVSERTLLKETLEAMNGYRLGIACVTGPEGRLSGIFTDGDLRRMLLKDQKPFSALFADDTIVHTTTQPTTATPDMLLTDAVLAMEARGIWDLPVVDGDNRLVGLLHLHPAIKALLGL